MLTTQASLPIFPLIAIVSYIIGFFNLIHDPALESSTFLVSEKNFYCVTSIFSARRHDRDILTDCCALLRRSLQKVAIFYIDFLNWKRISAQCCQSFEWFACLRFRQSAPLKNLHSAHAMFAVNQMDLLVTTPVRNAFTLWCFRLLQWTYRIFGLWRIMGNPWQ